MYRLFYEIHTYQTHFTLRNFILNHIYYVHIFYIILIYSMSLLFYLLNNYLIPQIYIVTNQSSNNILRRFLLKIIVVPYLTLNLWMETSLRWVFVGERMFEWRSGTSAILLHMQFSCTCSMQFSRTAFTIHHFLFVKTVQAGDLHAVQYFLSFCGKSRRSACRSHPPTFGSVDLLFLFVNK